MRGRTYIYAARAACAMTNDASLFHSRALSPRVYVCMCDFSTDSPLIKRRPFVSWMKGAEEADGEGNESLWKYSMGFGNLAWLSGPIDLRRGSERLEC